MGLITKTVIVKWNSKIKKYYESKGYIYTKMGDEFEVKIKDLAKGSHALVNVKCDCEDCKSPYLKPIIWRDYLKCVKEDDKYYCQKCSMKVLTKDKTKKTKLKNSKSFEEWCIENNRKDVLDRWDYELNKLKPNSVFYCSNNKYYFKCPIGLHKSELKSINSFTYGHEGSINCNQCNSFAQWVIDNIGEEFLDKYWDYGKNNELGIDPWEISHQKNIKVWIKCQKKDYHESSEILCSEFINGGRCSYCSNFKVHPLDSLGKLLEDKGLLNSWSNENKKSPYEYNPKSTQFAYWKCSDGKHEDYYRNIKDSNNAEFRCPKCSRERTESILQEKVRLYLESLNIYTILHEYNCNIIAQNPKIKNKWGQMPFDNEIKELKLIIETHGKQHYEIVPWHKSLAIKNNTTPEQELHYQKVKDRYKRMFAKSKINNYHYLEIPYYTDDEDKTWKKLINDKIDYIIKLKYIEERNKVA